MSEKLRSRVERLEAARAVKQLFARYQYLAAAGHVEELAELFSRREDVRAELADWGVFVGPERVRRIVLDPLQVMREHNTAAARESNPDAVGAAGMLMESAIMTPIVEVSPDASEARAVWMAFGANSTHQPGSDRPDAVWTWVHFHLHLVKEDGAWRILSFRVAPRFKAPYDRSWSAMAAQGAPPIPEGLVPAPDLPPSSATPSDYAVDRLFTYDPPAPEPWPIEDAADDEQLTAEETELLRRITALEDRNAIENLMSRHEYLHAGNENGLEFETCFTTRDDVTFEPEDWGVWEGADAVKDCYVTGAPPPMPGLLTEHATTTSLIEVADDGQTAKGIWISPGHETFPIPGQVPAAMWSWGRYAIDFVKEGGEWKFWHFHILTTFRTPFETSWVDNALNPAPGSVTPEGETPPGMPVPSRPVTVNLPYRPDRAPQLVPEPPAPFATFADVRSFTDPLDDALV